MVFALTGIPPGSRPPVRRPSCRSSGGHTQRDLENESRAPAELAFHPDTPAVHLDKLPADGQAESRATVLVRDSGVGLPELGEHRLELVRRNSDAGVRHLVDQEIALRRD